MPDGVRLTALGAPWMSTRTHILREYRAAEEPSLPTSLRHQQPLEFL